MDFISRINFFRHVIRYIAGRYYTPGCAAWNRTGETTGRTCRKKHFEAFWDYNGRAAKPLSDFELAGAPPFALQRVGV
jgi:hypothetical protein